MTVSNYQGAKMGVEFNLTRLKHDRSANLEVFNKQFEGQAKLCAEKIASEIVRKALDHFSKAIVQPQLRPFTLEHPFEMRICLDVLDPESAEKIMELVPDWEQVPLLKTWLQDWKGPLEEGTAYDKPFVYYFIYLLNWHVEQALGQKMISLAFSDSSRENWDLKCSFGVVEKVVTLPSLEYTKENLSTEIKLWSEQLSTERGENTPIHQIISHFHQTAHEKAKRKMLIVASVTVLALATLGVGISTYKKTRK